MSEPKRHHLVPEFYLRRLAHNGIVELVDRHDPQRVNRVSVQNALVEKHFYGIDTEDGRDTAVEKMFASHVEGPASRALVRVIDDKKPCSFPGLRQAISMFLAFQFVRGPSTRHASVERFKAHTRKVLSVTSPEHVEAVMQRQGRSVTPEEAAKIVKFAHDGQYDIGVSSEANLHLSSALKNVLELVPFFKNRKWLVLDFKSPVLLTGDEPVALIREPQSPGEASGLLDAPEVVFPTDPWHALVLIRPDRAKIDDRHDGTQRMADVINSHVAFNCHRYLVRYPSTDPLAGRSIPDKADPVVSFGKYVVIQPRVSTQSRKAWLKKVTKFD